VGLTQVERMRMRVDAVRSRIERRFACWFGSAGGADAARWRVEGERRRDAFYDEVWHRAAEGVGAEAMSVEGGMIEIRRGAQRTWVSRNYTALDDPAAQRLAENKPLVQRLLREADVPIPDYCAFTRDVLGPALEFLQAAQTPCVVKPAHGTGAGQGVHTQIRTRRELLAAIPAVSRFGPRMMIEPQVAGDTFRLVFLDGELLDATRRSPPTVAGDGEHTVRQLVIAANEARIRSGHELSQTGLFMDGEMLATLRAGNMHLDSVPAAGETIAVKTVVNENCARENAAALPEMCDEVIAAARATAMALGIRVVGVDILTTDAGRPLVESGGVVLEANTGPGFHYHYHRTGGPFSLAQPLLEAILRAAPEARSK
jgi:D-alanine-D-alanine ligase-like ATP-grasp enzyme